MMTRSSGHQNSGGGLVLIIGDVELLEQFARYQQLKRLKPNTLYATRRAIERTLAATERTAQEITTQDLCDFFASEGAEWADRTIHSYLSALRGFFEWMQRRGLRADDPTIEVPRPKVRQTLPRPAEIADIARVVDGLEYELRIWVLLMTLNGLRCCEVARLRWENVSSEHVMRVHGKDDRWRFVPMHPHTREFFDADLVRRIDGPVFRGPDGDHFTPSYISRTLNRVFRTFTDLPEIKCHMLRHTFATEHAHANENALLLARLMGHSNFKNTMIYTGVKRGRSADSVEAIAWPA